MRTLTHTLSPPALPRPSALLANTRGTKKKATEAEQKTERKNLDVVWAAADEVVAQHLPRGHARRENSVRDLYQITRYLLVQEHTTLHYIDLDAAHVQDLCNKLCMGVLLSKMDFNELMEARSKVPGAQKGGAASDGIRKSVKRTLFPA